MFSLWFLGPYLLVDIRGHGSISGGLILGIAPTTTAAAAWVAGWLTNRLGLRALTRFGLASLGVGLVIFSRADAGTHLVVLIVALSLVGIGLGSFQVPNMSFVMASIPRSQQGVAGGMTQMVRTSGLVAGLAVWNTAFVGFRDRQARSLGLEDLSAPEIFVPTFAKVVGLAGLLALVGILLTVGVNFDQRFRHAPNDET